MPTQNRRVATYLPKELDDRLKTFISERNLKGDSPALIAILSEYFGVSHQVAQSADYSFFVTQEQFSELAEKVSGIAAEVESSSSPTSLTGELYEKIRQLEERINFLEILPRQPGGQDSQELPIASNKSIPGQMDLLEAIESSELQSELPNDKSELSISDSSSKLLSELKPMKGSDLSRRLGVSPQSITNNKTKLKNNPGKLAEWTKRKDPDGIAWRYSQADRHYHPFRDEEL